MKLYPGAKPCIGCGYCCRAAACTWGFWKGGASHTGCKFLEKAANGQFRCGLYLAANGGIKALMERDLAFGAGCSLTLFNEERDAMERHLSIAAPSGRRDER